VAEEVHAVAKGISDMLAKPTLNSSEEKRAFDVDAIFSPFDGLSPEPSGQYCPQSAFEPMLLALIRRHGSQARYHTELDSFQQDDRGVTAVIRDRESGATETVRADYLVAADGVHSPIREALGVRTSGYGPLPIYVVFIYFRAPWRKFVPQLGDGDAVQVANADVEGIFLPVRDDFGMFITTYFPGNGETADQFTAQRCQELLTKAIGEPTDVEIIDVAPWQPYERVANQLCSGRTFLVGDSAHTMPPFKAGGANTAIQSAHNLAWKLAAVINGTAAPDLLTTYHVERHPVGRFNARQSLTGPSLAFLRLDDNRPQLRADEEAPMFPLLIGYQYRSAAVVTDDPLPADPDAVSLVEELRGQPGTRVPHAWVVDAGKRVSSLDLLGPGFTLFTGEDDAAWPDAAASVSTALGVPISVQRMGTAVDIDGAWAAATGLAPDGALLVRPDDFVAWRADERPPSPEAELRRVLCQILGRTS
jgi:2-polyprenyl-6-methoxyphenol hydroxylase-like FAD-dependent oxidoreductase